MDQADDMYRHPLLRLLLLTVRLLRPRLPWALALHQPLMLLLLRPPPRLVPRVLRIAKATGRGRGLIWLLPLLLHLLPRKWSSLLAIVGISVLIFIRAGTGAAPAPPAGSGAPPPPPAGSGAPLPPPIASGAPPPLPGNGTVLDAKGKGKGNDAAAKDKGNDAAGTGNGNGNAGNAAATAGVGNTQAIRRPKFLQLF